MAEYVAVGIILEERKPVGLRICEISNPTSPNSIMDIPFRQIGALLKTHGRILNYDINANRTFFIRDARVEDMPVFDRVTGKLIANNVLVKAAVYFDPDTRKEMGYAVVDTTGKLFMLSVDQFKNWTKKYKFFDKEFLTKHHEWQEATPRKFDKEDASTELKESALFANDLDVTLKKAFQKATTQSNAPTQVNSPVSDEPLVTSESFTKGVEVSLGITKRPDGKLVFRGTMLDDIGDVYCVESSKVPGAIGGTGASVEKRVPVKLRLSRLSEIIRRIRPFYGAAFSVIDKIPVSDIKTMGVDGVRLYYNPVFAASLTEAECLFVLLHELYHIMMLHHERRGKRDAELFNIACDLYINSLLIKEFNLSKTHAGIPVALQGLKNASIAVAPGGLFSEAVKPEDTPEKIYEELKETVQQMQRGGGGQGQQGQGQNQQSQGGQQGQSQQGQGQQGGGQQGQGGTGGQQGGSGGQQSQGGNGGQQGQGNGGQNQQGQGNGQSQQGQGNGQGQQGQGQQGQQGQGQQGQGQGNQGDEGLFTEAGEFNIPFRGKQVTILRHQGGGTGRGQGSGNGDGDGYCPDILDRIPADTPAGVTNSEARALLDKVVEITKASGGYSEESSDILMRAVADAKAPVLDWRSVLVKLMGNALSDTTTTFQKPDRRFISRNQYYTGKKDIRDGIDNIYFAIDVSGSVSDANLGIVFKQINQIMKMPKFRKLKAKVLYWDTSVAAEAEFEGLEDYKRYLKKLKVPGGGGTNVNCVFEYIAQQKKLKGSALLEPIIIAIFSDGCFGDPSPKYKMFKDTLWVIDDTFGRNFNAPWGKVVKVKSYVTT